MCDANSSGYGNWKLINYQIYTQVGERYRFVLLNRISPAEFAHSSNNLPLEIGRMPCTKPTCDRASRNRRQYIDGRSSPKVLNITFISFSMRTNFQDYYQHCFIRNFKPSDVNVVDYDFWHATSEWNALSKPFKTQTWFVFSSNEISWAILRM